MKRYHTYLLRCPLTNQVKYVGCSANPRKRYQEHITKFDKSQTAKRTWLEKVKAAGMLPKMEIVNVTDCAIKARELEQQLLDAHIGTALNIHNPQKGKKSRKPAKTSE